VLLEIICYAVKERAEYERDKLYYSSPSEALATWVQLRDKMISEVGETERRWLHDDR